MFLLCNLQKTFGQWEVLTRHMQVHSSYKPHRYPHCNYAAKQKANLEMHLRIHSGVKDLACELCSKRFVTSGKHQQHLRSHTGEKAEKCSECPKLMQAQKYYRSTFATNI